MLDVLKRFRFLHIVIYTLLAFVMYIAMFSNVKPEKLNIELFAVADTTIRSPITIEDKLSTEKKQKKAADEEEDVYTLKKEYAQNRVDLVRSIFDSVEEVNEELAEEYDKRNREIENEIESAKDEGQANSETQKQAPLEPSISEKLSRLKSKLPSDLSKELSDTVFTPLLEASPDQLERAKDSTVTAVNNVMNNSIPASEVEKAKGKIENEIRYASLDSSVKNAIVELGKYAVIQNVYYDPAATEEKRQQAIDAVEPVKILQGQIIVEEGQLISREIYKQLEFVGLLDTDKSIQPFIGLALMIALIMAIIIYYFLDGIPTSRKRNTYLLIYGIIFTITILFMKMVSLFQQIDYSDIGYIVPVAMGPLLVKLLINERIAIVSSMIFAICGSIIFNEGVTGTLNFTIGLYYLFAGLAGVLFLSQHNRRAKILQAGLFISFINFALLTSILLLKNSNYSSIEVGSYIVMAIVSGIVAAVMTIGLLPFFEAGFGILSTMRLIELSNPNHPLLRKILTETPGTYHHSVMVANLAEAACEAIGANGLLARVASYYHDIGKTRRPHFFIENQLNIENPHDKIAPQLSKSIIIAHASDGAEYLKNNKMPKEFVDIALEHHGTTLLKYFYHQAKQKDDDIEEADFRYPGPKAQTKESAIIGIADSVEAAVRSLTNPTPEKIESLAKSIMSDRLQDGQFNECDLTLKELDIVLHSFCETLHGIFHSRIEYPEPNRQKVKQA
ncbi:HD family phosphohydrolase [Cytobacillus sp. S13-E01]|uniref:HD family phosphohydrolase n=1 Tax=Cytobacillus sp. S13-E01 TaxID=3031326 RepID=UPI0023D7BDDE|nr:HD family phosphohydrolase [Cytobacillus sp. S13-E01]MDF0727215.1 HD family phosphohydrolase [Cytobacillus sp. S13-E01]